MQLALITDAIPVGYYSRKPAFDRPHESIRRPVCIVSHPRQLSGSIPYRFLFSIICFVYDGIIARSGCFVKCFFKFFELFLICQNAPLFLVRTLFSNRTISLQKLDKSVKIRYNISYCSFYHQINRTENAICE